MGAKYIYVDVINHLDAEIFKPKTEKFRGDNSSSESSRFHSELSNMLFDKENWKKNMEFI